MKQKLELFGRCYATGCFEELESHLAEDCRMTSYWVMEPMCGKVQIFPYLAEKGKTLKKHNCCPQCTVVELVRHGGADCLARQEDGSFRNARITIWHQDGDLALLMERPQKDCVMVLLKLDKDGLISKIDFTDPGFFSFKPLQRI